MQMMYILIGLPGSGKSTYARKLEQVGIVRVNQDILRTRKACLRVATKALSEGKSVVIDRCNASKDQRKVWIDLAKKFNLRVEFQWLNRDKDLCIARAAARTDHETVNGPIMAKVVVSFFNNDFEAPSLDEGANYLLEVFSDEAADSLVQRVVESERYGQYV